jgi:hypothetical protein
MNWSAGDGPAEPPDNAATSNLRPKSSADEVRAAVRRRSARREMLLTWMTIAALIAAVLFGARRLLS